MNALIIASVASMIGQFNMENIKILLNAGYCVDVGCNFSEGSSCSREAIVQLVKELRLMGVNTFDIPFSRSFAKIDAHILAYKKIKRMISKKKYDFLHCHAPISSAIARLAVRKTGIPVIYTAHGFHFFNGASIFAWMVYYPVEWFLSRMTDSLITINAEDYERAQKRFHMKRLYQIPGVGIDVKRISSHASERQAAREALSLQIDDMMLLSVGELNKNKNHRTVIEALHVLGNRRIKYFVAGQGALEQELVLLANKYGLQENIVFLGYRDDIYTLLSAADIFVLPSRREGLGVAGLEAMAAGLAIVGSNVRGIKDYVLNGETGLLCNPESVDDFVNAIDRLSEDEQFRKKCEKTARINVLDYGNDVVNLKMKQIYCSYSQLQKA